VLPVGGVKEKILAAHRAGLRHVVLPKDNEADLIKLPQSVRDDMTITLAEHLPDVFDAAIGEAPAPAAN